MGLFDKFMGKINPDNGDDNYDDQYVFDGGDDNTQQGTYNGGYDNGYQGQAPANGQMNNGNTMNQTMNNGYQAQAQYAQQGPSMPGSTGSLELKVIRPEHSDSVFQIADHLLNGRTVVLNLEATNSEETRRMIDFLTGVAYSINGDLRKVANKTYVITPNSVDISDISNAIGNNGAKAQNNGNLFNDL